MNLKKEINDIKKWEEKSKRKYLKYKTRNNVYDFQQYDTIKSCGENVYNGKIDIKETETDQFNLLKNWHEFSEKPKPRTKKD